MDTLWEWASGQSPADFHIWGADLVYEYPPVREQFRARFQTRQDVIFLTFEQEGAMIGMCELTEPGPAQYTISRLILSPDRRDHGLGRSCLTALKCRAAREYGLQQLRLVVYEHNLRARACYEHTGFRYCRRLERPGMDPAWEMLIPC